MRIKRVLQGTALTALAAAAWMGAGSTDASAAISSASVQADADNGNNYVLNVTADNGDQQIMAAVVKPNGQRKVKITAWDVYNGTSAKIDLSKLNAGNDNYIALKTDKMDKPVFYGIAAAAKQTKVTFNAETAKVAKVESKKGSESLSDYTGDLEYRTANGNWTTFNRDGSLAGYQQQGATLYFRTIKEAATDENKTAKDKVIDITDDKNNTNEETVTQLGSLPGKEAKVNIGKMGNAPAVTVDYAKGTVTIKKGTESQIVCANTIVSGPAVGASATGNDTISLDELFSNYGVSDTEAILEVRKSAVNNTDPKKCKVASKWGIVKIEKPKAFTDVAGSVVSGTSISTDTAIASVTTGSGTTIEVKFALKGREPRQTKDGINITNKSALAYQYYVGTEAPTIDTPASKIKTLKAKPANQEKATVKIAKGSATGKIYIRVAGDKKSKQWVGQWQELVANIPSMD